MRLDLAGLNAIDPDDVKPEREFDDRTELPRNKRRHEAATEQPSVELR